MNKKANTVLFMIGATVANVVIMVAIFAILFVLYGRFVAPAVSPELTQIMLIVVFIGSIALTYFIYHRIIKWLSAKYDLDKHFEPIFRRKPN